LLQPETGHSLIAGKLQAAGKSEPFNPTLSRP